MLIGIATVQGGCKKDDNTTDTTQNNNNNNNNNNNQAPTENRVDCTIAGDDKAFTEAFGAFLIDAFGMVTLTINAETADGESMTLSLNIWNSQTGNFTMTAVNTSNIAAMSWQDDNSDSWSCPNFINNEQTNPATGNLSIDYWDGDKVSGTFSGTLASQNSTDTFEVTNGTFSAVNIN